ncbi:MAG: protein kinase [Akkermansia sp.]|nr:protein kinase [Akkermansia sp.]
MSDHAEIWVCPHCGGRSDISQLGFYTRIACPQCAAETVVHTQLANYRIESVLGIGGMSVVFQARDLVLGRPVAIKVLNDAYRDAPERIAQFENECSLMAKVRHENVVSVYSAGWARGQFYIAMELVDGRNLELIVEERGFLLPTDALEIVRQVALGLQSANESGLLHRDVKPGNVLITPEGMARVLDFGLSLEDKPGVETEDIIWATPYYVPPETLRREDENVQTDIYALGMALRNLLTGEATLPQDPHTIADMLVSKRTLPRLQSIAPHLEPSLCELADHMTAYDPADRPASYADLLLEVEEVQQALVLAATPEERARRRRSKLMTACGGLGVVAAGLAGAFLVSWMTPSAYVHEALDAEVLQWEERDTYREAERLMREGNTEQASELLVQLAQSDVELSIAASATLLRTCIDALENRETTRGYERFDSVTANAATVSPLGATEFEKMLALMSSLRMKDASVATHAGGLENPLLKAAALVLAADVYVGASQREVAEELLNQAAVVLSAHEARALNEKLEAYRVAVPRRTARIMLAETKKYLREGQLTEGLAQVDEVLKQKLTRLEREEMRVLGEAADIALVLRETLEKQGLCAADAEASPSQLSEMAAGLKGNTHLAAELNALALLLQGDYAAAFRSDPHASQADSNEPFAVMMRDWKARLEM